MTDEKFATAACSHKILHALVISFTHCKKRVTVECDSLTSEVFLLDSVLRIDKRWKTASPEMLSPWACK